MSKEIQRLAILIFEKNEFNDRENPTLLENVDIYNIQVSSMISSSEKNILLITKIMIIKLNHYA